MPFCAGYLQTKPNFQNVSLLNEQLMWCTWIYKPMLVLVFEVHQEKLGIPEILNIYAVSSEENQVKNGLSWTSLYYLSD